MRCWRWRVRRTEVVRVVRRRAGQRVPQSTRVGDREVHAVRLPHRVGDHVPYQRFAGTPGRVATGVRCHVSASDRKAVDAVACTDRIREVGDRNAPSAPASIGRGNKRIVGRRNCPGARIGRISRERGDGRRRRAINSYCLVLAGRITASIGSNIRSRNRKTIEAVAGVDRIGQMTNHNTCIAAARIGRARCK